MKRLSRIDLMKNLAGSKAEALERAKNTSQYIISCLNINNSNWIVKEFADGKIEKLKKIES